MPFRDDDFEELDEEEYPDSHSDEEGNSITMKCPHCRNLIFEEAEQCPHCGMYLTVEDSPSSQPLWIVVGAVLLLITIVLFWVLAP